MNDKAAASAPVAEHAATPRRGGPSGRLVVGEYVGALAADAAQAVRRAGLRPGLDRSFGCAPELIGQVVAQEPSVGSDLARNGLVTLYVAAPGAAKAGDSAAAPAAPEGPATGPPTLAHESAERASPLGPGAHRRRKPRRAARTPGNFDPPPAPVPSGDDGSGEAQMQDAEPNDTQEWDREGGLASASSEAQEPHGELTDGPTHEEFVVHADDLFAGRAGGSSPGWRRVYPRRVSPGLRARLGEHPWLVRTALALLALWIVVGVASALAGHPARPHRSSPQRQSAEHTRTHAIRASNPSTPRRTTPHVAPSSTSAPASVRRRAAPKRRRSRRVSVTSVATRPARVSAPAAAPAAATPSPASPPPEPAHAQSQGGLFSP